MEATCGGSSMNNFECPRCGHCCQALEEKQEPLYWSVADGWVYADDTLQKRVDVKAKREHEWVGLTEEEKIELWNKHENHWRFEDNLMAFTRAIEQALKEKNI